ncbi:MAG: methyltransferase domain-containing protein [Patescibacteria group bacterium]|jgi:SAM-dependent methyltransferase
MNLETIKINKTLIKDIFIESWRGKTIDRIFLNSSLRSIELSGDILDLGSGSKKNSYHRFIKYKKPYTIKFTDLYKNTDDPDIIKLDLETSFTIADASFEAITCFNVLEHIYNHQSLVNESSRVLKNNGLFVGSVPFLVNYHGDPNDYWRYTWQSLENIFVKANMSSEKIIVLATGPLMASFLQIEFMIPKFIKPFFILWDLYLDSILVKWKKFLKHKHVLGYLFVFKKN